MTTIVATTAAGPPLTEQDLHAAEVQIGTRLPHDYRRFLLRFNGGQPTPDEFSFKSGRDGSLVNMFLAVNHPRPMFDLVRARANWKESVPSDLLVIALDAGGSLVCLGVRGECYGQVYFCSLEDEPAPPDRGSHDNVWLIADSFEQFLQSFRES